MPNIHLVIPHNLSEAKATELLNGFLDGIQKKGQGQVSNLQQSWEGNTLNFSFTTFGIGLKGKAVVSQNKLDVDVEVPFTAMMFKGKIESSIRDELEKLVAPE